MRFADDLVSPLRVVSVRDPAIDWASMMDAGISPLVYAETRDADCVRALPGQHPRWYVLQPLSVADCGMIDGLSSDPLKLVQAFRLSVAEVHDFHGPGVALRPTLAIPAPQGRTRMIWGDDELQMIANAAGGMRLIYEIGGIAYERAQEGNALSGGVVFTPPLFLRPVLEQTRHRLAERHKATAGIPSKSNQVAPSPRMSGPSSDGATAANAASGPAVQGA